MIYEESFQNAKGIVLENNNLKAMILPEYGGKITSILHKTKNFELLFQNPKDTFSRSNTYSVFSDFEACGFDDAFPSVDECNVIVNGKEIKYPDHGEIWSANFSYEVKDDRVILSYTSKILPYTYQKIIMLKNNEVCLQWKIKNIGEYEFPCIWTMHSLVNYEEDMKLLIPQGDKILVHSQKNELKWWLNDSVEVGHCGYEYPSKRVKVWFDYDANKLPYLGYWETTGGFRGDMNCALEPSNGYYDSIITAQKNNARPLIKPNEIFEFKINIRLEDY